MSTLMQKATKNASNRVTAPVALAVTATANTDFIVPVPAGAQDITFTTVTTTAFGAATDMTIQIGSTATGAEYVAATTIKAIGRKAHALVDTPAAAYVSFPGTAYVRLIQTGTASAVGVATLFIGYSLPTS